MKDTQPIIINGVSPEPPAKKSRRGWKVFLYVVLGLTVLFAFLYLVWIGPALQKPISEPLSLPAMVVGPVEGEAVATLQPPSNLEKMPVFVEPTAQQASDQYVETKLTGLYCWSALIIVTRSIPMGWRM